MSPATSAEYESTQEPEGSGVGEWGVGGESEVGGGRDVIGGGEGRSWSRRRSGREGFRGEIGKGKTKLKEEKRIGG